MSKSKLIKQNINNVTQQKPSQHLHIEVYLEVVVVQKGLFRTFIFTQQARKESTLHPDVVYIQMSVSVTFFFKLSITYVTFK